MADRFARKTYLQELPDRELSARFSSGARSRAAQLREFLRGLQAPARAQLGAVDGLELVVLNRRDWGKLFSYPYGWPLTRRHPAGVSIVAAADYPPKLLHRWDDVLVRAARAGVRAPGTVRAFLDLLVGYEWGRAVAARAGLRSRVGWLDELLASYLYLAASGSLGGGGASTSLPPGHGSRSPEARRGRPTWTLLPTPEGGCPLTTCSGAAVS